MKYISEGIVVLIRHIGHAEFYIETESGFRMVTDPYDTTCGYPVRRIEADAVLVSHGHHDHNAVENVIGNPRIINRAGKFTPEPDVHITAVRGYHDDVQGTKRGETLMFLIETEGLRIVHMGDIGCMIDEEQIRILKKPDILMIPVGGFYTIDGKQAQETARNLKAQTILPMHYRTQFNASWPISCADDFLNGYENEEILRDAEALRITDGDAQCHPKVVLFRQ